MKKINFLMLMVFLGITTAKAEVPKLEAPKAALKVNVINRGDCNLLKWTPAKAKITVSVGNSGAKMYDFNGIKPDGKGNYFFQIPLDKIKLSDDEQVFQNVELTFEVPNARFHGHVTEASRKKTLPVYDADLDANVITADFSMTGVGNDVCDLVAKK